MIKFFLGFRSLESLSVTWKTQCFEFISSPCSWFHGNYHALTSQVLGVHSKEINTNSCVNSRSFQTLQELRKSCWIKREQTQEKKLSKHTKSPRLHPTGSSIKKKRNCTICRHLNNNSWKYFFFSRQKIYFNKCIFSETIDKKLVIVWPG
jgi:hypothetical protein